MQTKHYLTLSDAEFLLDQAHQYAIQNNFNVSIAVVDETGNLLAMKRMDGASPMTANLCLEKAHCSAISRRPSKLFEDIIKGGQMGFLTMDTFSGMLEGGEPILYQGQLVGAMGVSGVKSFEDAEIAQVAIEKFLAQLS
ncbi:MULTISPECIES: GlcG/HbpS family heme-binding protein [Acinetobacter]|jgi:glc operon protein GlcG|uniref:GlcG/HbpS family heme-binding protein n=1 Tax=Acinetobacter TaxID=469 RepID=UPI0021CD8D6B|nr:MULTISPECIES: heme-binding protein [Acinetobacter]MCU4521344.1 heme-binding protein [Acinetobacter schindleri]MDP1446207.1 heme-binding protein [Acinetobacter schindleri]WDE15008.1 heme-binding protein [Acinetobacter schindleri]WQI98516.1 heme-binding protein [Acinetobacter schindleri]